MKKYFFCLLLLSIALNSFAQNKSDSTNSKVKGIIKFYPLQVLVGEVRLGYEKPISKKMSIEFDAGYLFAYTGVLRNEYLFTWMHLINSSFGYHTRIGIEYNYKHNTFISLSFLYKYYSGLETNRDDERITLTSFGAQSLFGKRFPISHNIGLEIFGGIGIRKTTEIDGYLKRISSNYIPDIFVFPSPQFGLSLIYKLYKK
jgi:hypothetical protein